MAKKTGETRVTAAQCGDCHCDLGEGAKVQPFDVDGELWCPECFSWHRAPLEPARFQPGSYAPLRCGSCKWTTTGIGRFQCGRCGSPSVIMLPPKPMFTA